MFMEQYIAPGLIRGVKSMAGYLASSAWILEVQLPKYNACSDPVSKQTL